jgi:hypothetical protein
MIFMTLGAGAVKHWPLGHRYAARSVLEGASAQRHPEGQPGQTSASGTSTSQQINN